MKKTLLITLLVLSVAAPAMALSVVASSHDMIASGFASVSGGAPTEVCIFCHTPHGAQASVTQAPLWNAVPEASLDAAYSVYTSSTTNFVSTVPGINATDARLCLSCHDGSVGEPVNMPNVGSLTITAAVMDANAVIGTNLSNDHPIGMNLGTTPETADLRYDGTSNMRTIAAIKTNFGGATPFFGSTDDSINIMWCSSCHDVHDSDPLKAPFLRKSNVGSALCKACHIK